MKNFIKLLLVGLLLITADIYAFQQPKLPRLSQQQIAEVVHTTIEALEHHYLFPEKALLAKKVLKYQLLSGELYQLETPRALAQTLVTLIRQSTGDNYVELIEKQASLELEHPRQKPASDRVRFGTVTVDIFDGNIGYLRFDRYYSLALAQQDIDNAMHYLAKVQALIIDLRASERGSLALSQYLMSIFIKPGTKLSDISYRQAKASKALLSLESSQDLKFQQQFPLYIINSAFVAGAWEFFSYTLKHFDKAVIIGEPTMGLGYLTKAINVSEDFAITIPNGMTRHPVTDTNWQQFGVIPDFEITAAQALALAYKLALASNSTP